MCDDNDGMTRLVPEDLGIRHKVGRVCRPCPNRAEKLAMNECIDKGGATQITYVLVNAGIVEPERVAEAVLLVDIF